MSASYHFFRFVGFLLLGVAQANFAAAQSASDGAAIHTAGLPPAAPSPGKLSEASPSSARARPARPNGRPGNWINDNDYPAETLKAGIEGIVHFFLTVGADGLPSACEITGKGVDPTLEKVTCELLMKRAHFFPATDEDGKPVMGVFSSAVGWLIPVREETPPKVSLSRYSYDIKRDGFMANCTMEGFGLTSTVMAHYQEKCSPTRFPIPVNASGKPTAKHVVISNSVTVTDMP